MSFDCGFSQTATRVRQQGGELGQIRFVVALRVWF